MALTNEEKYERAKKKAYEAKQRAFERKQNRDKNTDSYRLREFLNVIRYSNRTGSHVNCYRGTFRKDGATDPHEDRKYEVYKQLRKWGHDVICEPIFADYPGRGDVLDLNSGILFEVTHTETAEKLASKENYYPPNFEIRRVPAQGEFKEDMLL